MGLSIYVVDAFAAQPFAGNPAAVCLLEEPRDDTWMQNVAREMKHSETAFLLAQSDGFGLRWFTPSAEVDLCGHATLAGAHILWETSCIAPDEPIRFHTRSGLLTAVNRGDWIELDFPSEPVTAAAAPPELIQGLRNSAIAFVGRNRLDYLVELESEEAVLSLAPDFVALAKVSTRGICVTACADDPECDFISRFFAPQVGIAEDPVTGSAHCALAPYWGERLGKNSLVGYQASARGGLVTVQTAGERVIIGGQAVTVLRGEIA